MHTVRGVPETDLLIVSGCVEPALARDFQDEWIEQLDREKRRALELMPNRFFDEDYHIAVIRARADVPATHRILELLGLFDKDDTAVGLNYQAPGGAQNFHQDNPNNDGVVYVVHGADDGAFDYAPHQP